MLFLAPDDITGFHREQLQLYGGSGGVLHPNLLASAAAAPRNLLAHDPSADLFELAAAYAYHLTQAHAFVDGNKRTAFLATLTFLVINGVPVPDHVEPSLSDLILAIAAGRADRADAALLIRGLLHPSGGQVPESCDP